MHGYILLAKLKHREEHFAGLLPRAANEDPSFAVRYVAVYYLCNLKESEPEVIKYYFGLFETVGNQRPPYVPAQAAPSRDALVKRLARIFRSDQHQKVEGLYASMFPYEADHVDLKFYAIAAAVDLDLKELIPEVKRLAEAPDPILRQAAKSALKAFEWRSKNR